MSYSHSRRRHLRREVAQHDPLRVVSIQFPATLWSVTGLDTVELSPGRQYSAVKNENKLVHESRGKN